MSCRHDGSNCNEGRSMPCACPCHDRDKIQLMADLILKNKLLEAKIKALEARLALAEKVVEAAKDFLSGGNCNADNECSDDCYQAARDELKDVLKDWDSHAAPGKPAEGE